ncbi:MAG: hypothetical protein DHS20C19_01900 [Acidimicrobiales bacterium]|nr:MAG: hypothetical protein DHS20C19_01900 [Acidimicrobiales bacterium]
MTAGTDRRLVSFYADDFTGGASSMEVLAVAGVDTVMFLEAPDEQQLARFPDVQAIGIAGVARSRSPKWMAANLPTAFSTLRTFGAPVIHYKTCSTFDSSPEVGSIGAAIEIGRAALGHEWTALVVGAPAIGRYQAFGNLFAGLDGRMHRLDRHPVMRQHPITPMNEADLGRHLAHQTDLKVGLVDLVAMKAGRATDVLHDEVEAGAKVVAIDVIDEETLQRAGELIWAGEPPVFAVGSQGVEYALIEHWRALGIIPDAPRLPPIPPSGPMLAVSGSCSAVTARQIGRAADDGFHIVDLPTSHAVDPSAWDDVLSRGVREVVDTLRAGRDVLVTTARGPEDPRVDSLRRALAAAGGSEEAVNDRIGAGLGILAGRVHDETALRRVVIAGGDTSGHAMTALGADALSVIAPLSPGVPLCRVHSDNRDVDGLEVALKGGQMGEIDFFSHARAPSPESLVRP